MGIQKKDQKEKETIYYIQPPSELKILTGPQFGIFALNDNVLLEQAIYKGSFNILRGQEEGRGAFDDLIFKVMSKKLQYWISIFNALLFRYN